MIGISKLYCSTVEPSDPLRYHRRNDRLPAHLLQFSADPRPVVVFNATRACNLRCAHCYASSDGGQAPEEMSTDEARRVFDDLAAFGVPVLLLSGGEPLVRADLFELIDHARSVGLRTVLSSNGTRIDEATADRLAGAGLSYVGVSLDSVDPGRNDAFRGRRGAFDDALGGLRRAREAGLKTGLRFTLHRGNVDDVPSVFDLLEREGIGRVCFYHLVPAGRGRDLEESMLSHDQTRRALDIILRRTRECHDQGRSIEVLTVDNHADAGYLLLKLRGEAPARAEAAEQLLRMNGGNASGRRIACIGWDGRVFPDQFWRTQTVGNVRERKFSDLWTDGSIELLAKLRDRRGHLRCRCTDCRFLDVCNGNLRARAEAAGNGIWGEDPACYLTDEEIRP
jgi:Fe-coproporphyrin III synthase